MGLIEVSTSFMMLILMSLFTSNSEELSWFLRCWFESSRPASVYMSSFEYFDVNFGCLTVMTVFNGIIFFAYRKSLLSG